MILDSSGTFYTRTFTINSERVKVPTYTLSKTSNINVQFASLSETEQKQYGYKPDMKRVIMYRDTSIVDGMRLVYNSVNHDVTGVIHGNIHTAFLAIPQVGT